MGSHWHNNIHAMAVNNLHKPHTMYRASGLSEFWPLCVAAVECGGPGIWCIAARIFSTCFLPHVSCNDVQDREMQCTLRILTNLGATRSLEDPCSVRYLKATSHVPSPNEPPCTMAAVPYSQLI